MYPTLVFTLLQCQHVLDNHLVWAGSCVIMLKHDLSWLTNNTVLLHYFIIYKINTLLSWNAQGYESEEMEYGEDDTVSEDETAENQTLELN